MWYKHFCNCSIVLFVLCHEVSGNRNFLNSAVSQLKPCSEIRPAGLSVPSLYLPKTFPCQFQVSTNLISTSQQERVRDPRNYFSLKLTVYLNGWFYASDVSFCVTAKLCLYFDMIWLLLIPPSLVSCLKNVSYISKARDIACILSWKEKKM